MGFGFSWEHEPPECEALHQAEKAALAAWDGKDRDAATALAAREAVDAYWQAVERHGLYWGAGYGWFHRAIESEMICLGMVYGDHRNNPPWPESCRCDGDVEDWRFTCCPSGLALTEYLARPGPHPERGIPAYKFSSSDGWLLTPEEITSALKRFEEARERGWAYGGEPEDARHFDKWIRYIYCGRGYGGVRVH